MRKVAKKLCKLSLFSQLSAPIKSGVTRITTLRRSCVTERSAPLEAWIGGNTSGWHCRQSPMLNNIAGGARTRTFFKLTNRWSDIFCVLFWGVFRVEECIELIWHLYNVQKDLGDTERSAPVEAWIGGNTSGWHCRQSPMLNNIGAARTRTFFKLTNRLDGGVIFLRFFLRRFSGWRMHRTDQALVQKDWGECKL